MTSSRFRRRRQPQTFADDFQSDESITETMAAIQADDEWDGATFTFDGASAGTMPPAEDYRKAIAQANREARAELPAPVRAPAARQMSGDGWTMTLTPGNPGPVPADDRLRNALECLKLKVAYLESEGMGYRIDDSERLRQRNEKLDGRSIIARTRRESSAHLLGPRDGWLTRNSGQPWAPAGGWNEEWMASR